MRNTIITTALATLALAATATPVAAADEAKTAFVEYADLNLNSEVGMQTLQGRIRNAVKQVCPRGSLRSVQHSASNSACREAAFESAESQIEQLRRGDVEILAIRAERENPRNQ